MSQLALSPLSQLLENAPGEPVRTGDRHRRSPARLHDKTDTCAHLDQPEQNQSSCHILGIVHIRTRPLLPSTQTTVKILPRFLFFVGISLFVCYVKQQIVSRREHRPLACYR